MVLLQNEMGKGLNSDPGKLANYLIARRFYAKAGRYQ
jgi:hypothetical protein